MATNFLSLPAELRLMVYPHILSADDPFENIATILALRLSCRRINLDITHEFITAVTKYHSQKLNECQYSDWVAISLSRYDGTREVEEVKEKALENLRNVRPETFANCETLTVWIPLYDILECRMQPYSNPGTYSHLLPLWEFISHLLKQVRNVVFTFRARHKLVPRPDGRRGSTSSQRLGGYIFSQLRSRI
jgi:hypothetical protein